MPSNYNRDDLPDTTRWPHDEYWDQSIYDAHLGAWLCEHPGSLAFMALSPAAAPSIHSDEWNSALLHALAATALYAIVPL